VTHRGPLDTKEYKDETDDASVTESLAGLNANADRTVVQRTRRVVLESVNEHRQQRTSRRRATGLAILVLALFFVLLSPAIWSGVDDLLGGEHVFDMPGMVMGLILMLFCAVLGALVVGWKNQRDIRHGKRF
jgi:hypothetical protein